MSLPIRNDPDTNRSLTTHQLYEKGVNYDTVVGASGTANGKGDLFAQHGLSDQVHNVERYYQSRLKAGDDQVYLTNADKLDGIAADTATSGPRRGRPTAVDPGPRQRPGEAAVEQADRAGCGPHRDRRALVPQPGVEGGAGLPADRRRRRRAGQGHRGQHARRAGGRHPGQRRGGESRRAARHGSPPVRPSHPTSTSRPRTAPPAAGNRAASTTTSPPTTT